MYYQSIDIYNLDDKVKRKNLLIFSLLLLDFILMSTSVTIDTRAQSYAFNFNEDDEFVWEIKELDLHNFKKVFGFEPNYEQGDQLKKKIRSIINFDISWSLTVEAWDYSASFEGNGTIEYYTVHRDVSFFDEDLFVPTPVADYLAAVDQSGKLGSEYSITGYELTKRAKGVDGSRYTMHKIYDSRGIVSTEKYTDDDQGDRVIIEVVGTFSVPYGETYLVFMGLGITAVVIVMIKRKSFEIKKS